MHDPRRADWIDNAGSVLRAVILIGLLVGPLLWVFLADIQTVTRVVAQVHQLRAWLQAMVVGFR